MFVNIIHYSLLLNWLLSWYYYSCST